MYTVKWEFICIYIYTHTSKKSREDGFLCSTRIRVRKGGVIPSRSHNRPHHKMPEPTHLFPSNFQPPFTQFSSPNDQTIPPIKKITILYYSIFFFCYKEKDYPAIV